MRKSKCRKMNITKVNNNIKTNLQQINKWVLLITGLD